MIAPAVRRHVKPHYPWLPPLPEHWRVMRIKHTTFVKGRIGWQGLRSDEFTDDGPLLVTGTDFKQGQVDWSSCHHISEQRYREDPYIHLREGDLLITKDGTIGKIAIVKGMPGPACLNSGVFVTRPSTGLYENRYLYWLLTSDVFQNFINLQKSGTTISHLYPLPSKLDWERVW
jgi:type I restriction enzyme, S subunit